MKKGDLVVGKLWVQTRDGDIGSIVMIRNDVVIANKGTYEKFKNYDENLIFISASTTSEAYDIVKVGVISSFADHKDRNPTWIWVREEIKEITMKELEEQYGCKVKIVK
jgi:hypothetical protein